MLRSSHGPGSSVRSGLGRSVARSGSGLASVGVAFADGQTDPDREDRDRRPGRDRRSGPGPGPKTGTVRSARTNLAEHWRGSSSAREELATHRGTESWVGAGDGSGQALTGGSAGAVLSSEIIVRNADLVDWWGRPYEASRHREWCFDSSESETRCMHGCVLCGTWEVQTVGKGRPPTEKGVRHDAVGQAVWNSDDDCMDAGGRATQEQLPRP